MARRLEFLIYEIPEANVQKFLEWLRQDSNFMTYEIIGSFKRNGTNINVLRVSKLGEKIPDDFTFRP